MKFFSNNLFKLVFTNHILKIVAGGINFGFIALISKIANAEVLGQFSTLYAAIGLISGLVFWGLADGFVLLVNKIHLKELVLHSIILCLINGLISLLFLPLFTSTINEEIIIYAILIIFSNIFHYLTSTIYRIIGRYNSSIFYGSIQPNFFFLLFLISIFFIQFDLSANFLIKLYFYSHLASFLLLSINFIYSKANLKISTGNYVFSIKTLIYIYKHNASLMVSNILNNFVGTIDILILNRFLSAADIGIFKVASSFGKLIKISLSSFSNYMLPQLTKMIHEKSEGINSYILLNYKYIAIIAFTMVIGVAILGDIIIDFVFGRSFNGVYEILMILLIGYSFNNLCGPNGTILLALGKKNDLLIIDLIVNVLGVFLLFALSWKFSLRGAAAASVIMMIKYNVLKNILLKKSMPQYRYVIKKINLTWIIILGMIASIFTIYY